MLIIETAIILFSANSDKERVHVMEDPLILSVTTADPDTLVSSHSTELTLVVTPEMTPLPTSVPRPVTDRAKGDENKEGKTEGNFENGL